MYILRQGYRWFRRTRQGRWFVRGLLAVVIALNAIAYVGAYGMTHFCAPGQWCIGLPRPSTYRTPTAFGLTYTTQRVAVSDTEWIETWLIPARQPSRGTVLLFPGNRGSKAKQLLAPAQVFHQLGYDAVLTDFRGLGGSSGHTTTIGVREAEDVALVMAQIQQQQDVTLPLILYGISMGGVAIMKAIATDDLSPDAIILEAPFPRLLDSVKRRLAALGIPTVPLAELIVFWGSVQHGFNGFVHNPVTYAQRITCPALVFQGDRDRWFQVEEIKALVAKMPGDKQLVIFPDAGHQLLVTVDAGVWQQHIQAFLSQFES